MATGAADQSGIMALPEADTPPQGPPKVILNSDSFDAYRTALDSTTPEGGKAMDVATDQIMQHVDQMSDSQLDALISLLQTMIDHPDMYEQIVQKMIEGGNIQEGDLPEKYDSDFISTVAGLLLNAERKRNQSKGTSEAQGMGAPEAQGIGALPTGMPGGPQGFARGGIAEAVRMVASKGRNGDTMLAHINPQEARILKSMGGSGTINPATGLHEYSWLGDVVQGVSDAVSSVGKGISDAVTGVFNAAKDFVSSPIGRIIATVALATFLGPGAFGITGMGMSAAVASGLAGATISLVGGGDIKDALIAGATSYFSAPGSPISNAVGAAMGPSANAALVAGTTGALVGTGAGLVQGKNLEDSVKQGLTQGAISGATTWASTKFGKAEDVTAKDTAGAPKTGAPENVTSPKDIPVKDMATVGPDGQGGAIYKDQFGRPTYQVDANGNIVKQFPASSAAKAAAAAAAPGANPNAATRASESQYATNAPPALAPGANQGLVPTSATAGAPGPVEAPTDFVPSQNNPNYSDVAGQKGNTVWSDVRQAGHELYEGNYGKAFDAAVDVFAPAGETGFMRTYAPAIAGGLAVAGATGAFDQKPVPKTELQNKMEARTLAEYKDVENNPGKYVPQNQEGVTYGDKGQVIGTGGAYNYQQVTPESTQVGTRQVLGQGPSTYTPPTGSLTNSRGPVAQPYNMYDMYTNLMPQYYQQPRKAATGGIADLGTPEYPRRNGHISGPGTETSDSIPAMLSDGEFVMTGKAVRAAGGGDRRAGAKKMYALMHQLERNAVRG